MSEYPVKNFRVAGPAGEIAVYEQGDAGPPVVFMSHSILSSSTMWESQAQLLAGRGWRVIRADTRGHGASAAPLPPYSMDDLAADTVAVLDALGIERAHYVGLSLGGMSGFGLGIQYPERLLSLLLCDARADAPAAFGAPWTERIAVAEQQGTAALADSTLVRWFGEPFLTENPVLARRFRETACGTAVAGLVGCARAIQSLDYLADAGRISAPTTLLVGANDGALPQAMKDIQGVIAGAVLEVIPGAGHLPNVDQPAAFDAALLRHLARAAAPH